MFLLEIPEQIKFLIDTISPLVFVLGFILLYYFPLLGILWFFIVILDIFPLI